MMGLIGTGSCGGSDGGGRRKRERSEEPVDQEYMPLSKRITCLNLNPGAGAEDNNGAGPNNNNGAGPNNNNGHYHFSSHRSDGLHSDNSSLSGSSSPAQSDYGFTVTNGLFELDEEMSSDSGVILMNGQSQGLLNNARFPNPQGLAAALRQGQGVSGVSSVAQAQVQNKNLDCNVGFQPHSFPYDPSLDQRANPYYYEQNRHLYDLYLERIQRTNVAPHPHVLSSHQPQTNRNHYY